MINLAELFEDRRTEAEKRRDSIKAILALSVLAMFLLGILGLAIYGGLHLAGVVN